MALEDTLREHYNKRIDEKESYDRDYFVDHAENLFKIERYYSKFKEDPNDPDNLSDLGKLLHKNPKFYNDISDSASVISIEGNVAYKTWADAMGRYVQKNMDDFFDLFEDKEWESLIMNIPLYKTGDDEYHDKFVEASLELREIREAESSKNPSKIIQYVASKLEELPQFMKVAISQLTGNQEYMKAMFNDFAGFAENRFKKELYIINGEDVKVDKSKLKKIIEDSLDKAWELHKDEEDKGDQEDIWENDIRNCYLTFAKIAYPKEAKEKDVDEDEDKQERKQERREYGLTQ